MELYVSLNTFVIFEVRNCIHLNSITIWFLLQVWESFTLLCNNRYGYYLPLKNINVQTKKLLIIIYSNDFGMKEIRIVNVKQTQANKKITETI